MKLRYRGTCRICQTDIEAGIEAVYEKATKTVRCAAHEEAPGAINTARPDAQHPDASVDVGVPGASARREHERRQHAREDRVRSKHSKIGGLILALTDDPQSTTAWSTGAQGEERLGARLNELSTDSVLVLHDRRIPRTRANIDHLAVTPTGIWVIDAKKYQGRPSLKVEGGILRQRTERLLVGSRDCTKLVDGVLKQVALIEDALLPGGRPEGPGRPWGRVPVRGVLCVVEADWPLLARPFKTRDVLIAAPKKIYPELQAAGPLALTAIGEIHRHLAGAFPPA